MDQDDGDVDFQAAQGEPDRADHERSQGDAPACRPEFGALERLLLSRGQGEADSRQHGE